MPSLSLLRSIPPLQNCLVKLSIRQLLPPPLNFYGSASFSKNCAFLLSNHRNYTLTTLVLLSCVLIWPFIIGWNIWPLTITLFVNWLPTKSCMSLIYPQVISLRIYLPSLSHGQSIPPSCARMALGVPPPFCRGVLVYSSTPNIKSNN